MTTHFPLPAGFALSRGHINALLLAWTAIAVLWHTGVVPWWWTPTLAVLAWLTVTLTATDLHTRRLPNRITLTAIPLTAGAMAVAALASHHPTLSWHALLGATLLTTFHATVHLIAPSTLGAGDVKLSPSLGAPLGATDLTHLPTMVALASAITLILHVATRARSRCKPHHRNDIGLPHAPGLLLSTTLLAATPP